MVCIYVCPVLSMYLSLSSSGVPSLILISKSPANDFLCLLRQKEQLQCSFNRHIFCEQSAFSTCKEECVGAPALRVNMTTTSPAIFNGKIRPFEILEVVFARRGRCIQCTSRPDHNFFGSPRQKKDFCERRKQNKTGKRSLSSLSYVCPLRFHLYFRNDT